MERFADRYLLLRSLGRGGMGEVFLARDLSRGTECALKRLNPGVAEETAALLQKEFESLAAIRHPAVVPVYERGTAPDGTPFITMEYVPGLAADRAVARGDWDALFFVAARVAGGLEALHAAGIFHGDVKPTNVLVVPGPRGGLPASVRLVDFGLAGFIDRDTKSHRGTPGYAAPELVAGWKPDATSDLYGLGATLYKLATGEAPFAGERAGAVLRAQKAGPPPALPLEEAGCPAELVELILRLMAPAPRERPESAGEVRREIERMHPAVRVPLAGRLDAAIVVGREAELGRIARLRTAAAKRTQVLLVTGSAGAGKSALLGEIAARAALAGEPLLRVSGARAAIPGATAMELLRLLAARAPAGHDEDPVVRRRIEDLDAPLREQNVEESLDAAVRWMRGIEGPLQILVDDAEQMDPLSARALRAWFVHPKAPSVLWVIAKRADGSALDEEDTVLVRAGVARHAVLESLSRAAVAKLISVRLANEAPDELVDRLFEHTGGHPGLTVEMLRSAAASGAVREDEAGILVDRAKLDALQPPENFEASIVARWRALDASPRAAALALAVWGRPVDRGRLRIAEPATDDASIDALLEAGFASADEAKRLALRPPAIGSRLLAAADPAQVQTMRRNVLEGADLSAIERFDHLHALGDADGALAEAERVFETTPTPRVAIAVAELIAGTQPERAAEWYVRAAEVQAKRGLHREVPDWVGRAISLAPRHSKRFRWWDVIARSELASHAVDQAARTIEGAFAEGPAGAERALLMATSAGVSLHQGENARVIAKAEEAVTLAEKTDSAEARAAGLLALSAGLIRMGELARAKEVAELASSLLRSLGDLEREATALGNLAIIASFLGNRFEAVRLHGQALEVARRSASPSAIQPRLETYSVALIESGQWTDARRINLEAMRIGIQFGLGRWATLTMSNQANMEALQGSPARARRRALAARRMARSYAPALLSVIQRALAAAHRIAGDPRRALAQLDESLALTHQSANVREWALAEKTQSLLALSRWHAADAIHSQIPTSQSRTSVGWLCIRILTGVAAFHLKHLEAAEDRLSEADRLLSKNPAPYAKAFSDTLRALIYFAHRRKDDGVRVSEVALMGFAELPAPPDRAWAAYEISRAALDLTDPPVQIAGWLDSAIQTFERLGNHRMRAQALALQLRWTRRVSTIVTEPARESNLIEQVSMLLGSFADPKEVATRAMRMVQDHLGAERGALLIIDPETRRLTPFAEVGVVDADTRREALSYSRKVVKRVTESGIGLLTGDVGSEASITSLSLTELGVKSVICVPVNLGGHVIGAIYLDDSRRTGAFSEDDQSALESFSHLMAIAVERSREHAEALDDKARLIDENVRLRRQVSERHTLEGLVGTSSQMRRVIAEVEQAATNDARVLITGEMGTGKEFVARTLHQLSKRRNGPFVMLNCGALPENLIESELFGILPNVATGVKARPGLFVEASGGTLFLDEVGEMPLAQQVKLLSVLSRPTPRVEVQPVGGGRPVPVDVRVVAATNQNLPELIREKRFREDLYYRLAVIPIELPPLRDRRSDIPDLAATFLREFAEQQQRPVPKMSETFVSALLRSEWPGNVRELQNYVERVLSRTPGETLQPTPLPADLQKKTDTVQLKTGRRLADMVEELERKLIAEALHRAKGNQSHAARELGMTEQSMRYKIRKYEMESARQNRRNRR